MLYSAPTIQGCKRLTVPTSFQSVDYRKASGTAPLAKHLSHPTLISTSIAFSRKAALSPLPGASAGLLMLGTRADQECILNCCSQISTVWTSLELGSGYPLTLIRQCLAASLSSHQITGHSYSCDPQIEAATDTAISSHCKIGCEVPDCSYDCPTSEGTVAWNQSVILPRCSKT